MYKVMDCDETGGLSLAELQQGLRKLKLHPPIHFSGRASHHVWVYGSSLEV